MIKLEVNVNNSGSNSSIRKFTMYFENEQEMNKFLMNLDHISKVKFVYRWKTVDRIPEAEDSEDSEE